MKLLSMIFTSKDLKWEVLNRLLMVNVGLQLVAYKSSHNKNAGN